MSSGMRTLCAASDYSMHIVSCKQEELSRLVPLSFRDEAVPAGRQHGPGALFENLNPCSWTGEIQELKRGPRASHAEAPSRPQPPGEPDADTALTLFLTGRRRTSGADLRGDRDDPRRDGRLSHSDGGLSHRDRRGPIGMPSSPIWMRGFAVQTGAVQSGWE